jgi:hypothetical protein
MHTFPAGQHVGNNQNVESHHALPAEIDPTWIG